MPSLDEIHREWDAHLTSMVAGFESRLQAIVLRAQAKLAAWLQRNLSITDGVIDQTPANLKILRRLDDRWEEFLNESGYDSLLEAFTNQFPGQLQYLDDTLKYLSDELRTPLAVKWTAADRSLFSSFALTSQAGIEAAVNAAAQG